MSSFNHMRTGKLMLKEVIKNVERLMAKPKVGHKPAVAGVDTLAPGMRRQEQEGLPLEVAVKLAL